MNFSVLLSTLLISSSLLSCNLSVILSSMRFIQSVHQATRADLVPPCQVGFRKHSSCCLVWAPCVGAGRSLPSPVHTRIEDLRLTDTIWTFTIVVHCLGAQMHKKILTSKQELLQKSTNMKREDVFSHSLCGSGVWTGRLCTSASVTSAALITL